MSLNPCKPEPHGERCTEADGSPFMRCPVCGWEWDYPTPDGGLRAALVELTGGVR